MCNFYVLCNIYVFNEPPLLSRKVYLLPSQAKGSWHFFSSVLRIRLKGALLLAQEHHPLIAYLCSGYGVSADNCAVISSSNLSACNSDHTNCIDTITRVSNLCGPFFRRPHAQHSPRCRWAAGEVVPGSGADDAQLGGAPHAAGGLEARQPR